MAATRHRHRLRRSRRLRRLRRLGVTSTPPPAFVGRHAGPIQQPSFSFPFDTAAYGGGGASSSTTTSCHPPHQRAFMNAHGRAMYLLRSPDRRTPPRPSSAQIIDDISELLGVPPYNSQAGPRQSQKRSIQEPQPREASLSPTTSRWLQRIQAEIQERFPLPDPSKSGLGEAELVSDTLDDSRRRRRQGRQKWIESLKEAFQQKPTPKLKSEKKSAPRPKPKKAMPKVKAQPKPKREAKPRPKPIAKTKPRTRSQVCACQQPSAGPSMCSCTVAAPPATSATQCNARLPPSANVKKRPAVTLPAASMRLRSAAIHGSERHRVDGHDDSDGAKGAGLATAGNIPDVKRAGKLIAAVPLAGSAGVQQPDAGKNFTEEAPSDKPLTAANGKGRCKGVVARSPIAGSSTSNGAQHALGPLQRPIKEPPRTGTRRSARHAPADTTVAITQPQHVVGGMPECNSQKPLDASDETRSLGNRVTVDDHTSSSQQQQQQSVVGERPKLNGEDTVDTTPDDTRPLDSDVTVDDRTASSQQQQPSVDALNGTITRSSRSLSINQVEMLCGPCSATTTTTAGPIDARSMVGSDQGLMEKVNAGGLPLIAIDKEQSQRRRSLRIRLPTKHSQG